MNRIDIRSRLYNYEVDFISDINNVLLDFSKTTTYVIDQNVYKLYKAMFLNINIERIYFVDAKEKYKNIDTVMDLIYFWKRINLKKNQKVICIGGGITQDITTFASNIYLRNIDWYFIPTTLLAMCDSCIGGKCGINLDQYKNQLGVFYPPKKIFVHTNFLSTLSSDDYINGWGELLKFALTQDKQFYEYLSNEISYIPCASIDEYIYKGLMVKKNIIEADEFEGDLRRVLNYGHTFGHALEAYTLNRIPHGKGVIWGIDVANYISYREGLLAKRDYLEIKRLICGSFIKEEIIVENKEKLFSLVKMDKKIKDSTIYLALLDRISHLTIYPMDIKGNLYQLFGDYLEETHAFYSDRLRSKFY